jgi:GT2 family glycosyltransferase
MPCRIVRVRRSKVRHFKSKKAYRKWLAYGHMRTKTGKLAKHPSRSVFATTPGHQKIVIRGKRHKVIHKRRK